MFFIKLKENLISHFPQQWVWWIKKYISIDFFLFGKAKKETGYYLLNVSRSSFMLFDMENEIEPAAIKWFKDCYERYANRKGFLRAYILQQDNCIIEPVHGWGIDTKTNKLIFDSISNNSWKEEFYPSYKKYISNKKNARLLPEVISIRMIRGGEYNYWHFLHDLLGQILLARKNNLDKIPFLISKNLSKKKYFQSALQQSHYLRSLEWIVQEENEYIKVKKAYFIQSEPHDLDTFYGLLDILEIPISNPLQCRKIFLTRSSKRIRHLQNNDEIAAIAIKYEFEIIDTDNLDMLEQIQLFGNTKYFIGIHGAGMTNVLFRKQAPMSVLELFPEDYIPPHYFWLSKAMGHNYLCLIGSRSRKKDASFIIDPNLFENKVRELLQK